MISIRALSLDDMGTLLGNLGWLDHEEMKCVSYDMPVLEFLSSIHMD